jgi:hypothetical protein
MRMRRTMLAVPAMFARWGALVGEVACWSGSEPRRIWDLNVDLGLAIGFGFDDGLSEQLRKG